MKANLNGIRIFCIFFCLFGFFGLAAGQGESPSPELVGMLTKELNVTPGPSHGRGGRAFRLSQEPVETRRIQPGVRCCAGNGRIPEGRSETGRRVRIRFPGFCSVGRGGRSRFGCGGLRISGTFSGHGVQVHSRDYAIRAVQGRRQRRVAAYGRIEMSSDWRPNERPMTCVKSPGRGVGRQGIHCIPSAGPLEARRPTARSPLSAFRQRACRSIRMLQARPYWSISATLSPTEGEPFFVRLNTAGWMSTLKASETKSTEDL